jgi:hypothetical protein
MDERVAAIRTTIERCRANGVAGRWRAPQELRAEVVALVRQRGAEGVSVERAAHELGLAGSTVQRWLESDNPALRQVMVEDGDGQGAGVRGGPVLVSPRGYRIEGLGLETLRTLLVALE